MRKILFVFLIVLLSAAWAAAQHNPTMPGDSGQSSSPNTGGHAVSPSADSPAGGQSTAPNAAPPAAADSKIIEGCLGGAAPNFTVTDKAGTQYKLDIPKDADLAPLTAHVGQAVKVKGIVTGEKASAGASSGSATASVSPTIQVEQMARGTGSCPAGSAPPNSK